MATPINRKTAEAPPAAAQRAERRAPRKQLGEFLVEKGLINRDQLRVATWQSKPLPPSLRRSV